MPDMHPAIPRIDAVLEEMWDLSRQSSKTMGRRHIEAGCELVGQLFLRD